MITDLNNCLINHSHKKQKDSLEVTTVWIFFTAELEFPKILVPRLLQRIHQMQTFTVLEIKTTALFMKPASWSSDISLFYCSDIVFWLIIPVVNYAINGCSSSRATVGTYHLRKNIVAVITQDRVNDGNLKRQIKNRTLYTWRLFFFNIIANGQEYFSFYPLFFSWLGRFIYKLS